MSIVKNISGFLFVRMTVVVWKENGPSRIRNVDHAAGQSLKAVALKAQQSGCPLVVDMRGIVTIIDVALNEFFKTVCEQHIEVHFLNPGPVLARLRALYDEHKGTMATVLHENQGALAISRGTPNLNKSLAALQSEIEAHIDSEIVAHIRDAFVGNPGHKLMPLSSTPILSTGQYDASLIISDPTKFAWTCIRMSDKVKALVDSGLPKAHLLSVSLRSSPFSSAISLLLDMQMRTIDHLGPIQKVWDYGALTRFGEQGVNYVFIGDFLVGGTELKMAHLFAKYSSSAVKNVVVLGTLFEESRYEDYSVHSFAQLKDLNVNCRYQLFME